MARQNLEQVGMATSARANRPELTAISMAYAASRDTDPA